MGRLAVFYDVSQSFLEQACEGATTVEAALESVMAALARQAGKARWIEKTPGNVAVISRIFTHWPDARFIHIIRDPRDVYASLIESGKWKQPEEFARRWCDTVLAARNWLAAEGGNHPAYMELRYEQLVSSLESELPAILAFLGEEAEPAVLQFSGSKQDFERVRQATGKESSTLRRLAEPLTNSRVSVWSQVLTDQQWQKACLALEEYGGLALAEEIILETEQLFEQ